MKVVFRADASAAMGTGHVMRCVSLAHVLRERGAEVHFVCREHKGNLIGLLQRRAFPVTMLPVSSGKDGAASDQGYAGWLGSSQAEDAIQTIGALVGERPDWLVVDHYALDIEWEQRLRGHSVRLMAIDDLANRRHDCDVLLDQNYSVRGKQGYAGLVPDKCLLLAGPRYALLQREYSEYRRTLRHRDGKVREVLVFFGGSDPQNMTGAALEALSSPALKHLDVHAVVGVNSPHGKDLAKQARKRPRTRLYGLRPHLADLMAQADLSLGAGGATTWERMCLGLPTIAVSIAENQRPACQALAESGLITYAGSSEQLTVDQLENLLHASIEDAEGLSERAVHNQIVVDGLGALRLAEVMFPSRIENVRLRPAGEGDTLQCYIWATEAWVKETTAPVISRSAHQAWFVGRLHDTASHLFILDAAGLAVGQVGLATKGDEAELEYSLDAIVQDRGWEPRLLGLAVHVLHDLEPVRPGGKGAGGRFLRMGPLGSVASPGVEGTSRAIAILSDRESWMNRYIAELLLDWLAQGHRVQWVHDKQDLRPGDFCFYLSCGQIVPAGIRSLYRHNLVVHESDLPRGKGWSPLSWQIVEGNNRIPVTLLEAAENVDSGAIYAQQWIEFQGHELIDELRAEQAKASIALCTQFVRDYPQILGHARDQVGAESSYRRRRGADSELDASRSIAAQFDLLRVVDNQRYPAFFVYRGHRYVLKIEAQEKA